MNFRNKEVSNSFEVAEQIEKKKSQIMISAYSGEGMKRQAKPSKEILTKLNKSIKYGKQHGGFGIEILYPR